MTSQDQFATVWKQGVLDCVDTSPHLRVLCDLADYSHNLWIARVRSQRKHNAKCRALSSSDKVISTSICFLCEDQTLLHRRNAFFVHGVAFSHCR